jgi:arylsulfatase A-like enzyme
MRTQLAGQSTLIISAATMCLGYVSCNSSGKTSVPDPRPNVVLVFADQWRAQATGYAGDPNAITHALDRLASQSVSFTTAVSNAPVSSPYRASLITGRYATSHGVFMNDVTLTLKLRVWGKYTAMKVTRPHG